VELSPSSLLEGRGLLSRKLYRRPIQRLRTYIIRELKRMQNG
jgi:hypothetical protein